MAISSNNVVAPLLGNFQPAAGAPGTASGRLIQGVSDLATKSFGLTGRSAVGLSLVEFTSPASSRLGRALSGFFDKAEAVRDAASTLGRVVEQGYRDNNLDADQVVSAASSLVTAIDDLRSFVKDNPDSLATGLLTRVDSATSNFPLEQALASIGITIDDDGKLTLNEGELRAEISAQPKFTAAALGLTSGLATRELDNIKSILNSSTVSVIGFSGRSGAGDFLVSSTSRTQSELSGRFVNLLV